MSDQPSRSGPGTSLPDRPRARRLVVVGASAGGVEALRRLVAVLPADLDACVLVVLHVPASGTSVLPAILDRAGPLPARHATEGDVLRRGEVLVAPPDRHLVVRGSTVSLPRGPRENGHRPSVDVLFRSAAETWGSRVVAVVLSGVLDDGAAGSVVVRSHGGTLIAQDAAEARYAGMPAAAAGQDGPALRLTIDEMPGAITSAVGAATADPAARVGDAGEPVAGAGAGPTGSPDRATEVALLDPVALHALHRPGSPSGFGCPDCAGALFVTGAGAARSYRCRVGHAWSVRGLHARQGAAVEDALWTAIRALQERAALSAALGEQADGGAGPAGEGEAATWAAQRDEELRGAEVVRRLLADLDLHLGASDLDQEH